ncbi:MAG: glycosyltransferase [Streptosporangiaceae bacterium]
MTAQTDGERAGASTQPATVPTTGVRVLQRIVLPPEGNLDVAPLYIDENVWHARAAPASDAASGADDRSDETQDAAPVASVMPGSTQSALRTDRSPKDTEGLTERRSAVLRAGRRVSFATYFNAFPASYWRRWTTVEEVRLRVRVRGDASVIVYRSTSKGHSLPVETAHVDDDKPRNLEFRLPLRPFLDGGWYWFDVAAGERDVTLEEADWTAETDRLRSGRLSIGITTFNRPDFCLDQLRNLGAFEGVLEVLDEIFIVDQGTKHVEDHPDFAAASKGLADRLRVLDQGNIGGSGGFSRAMDETVRSGQSDYILLLDDDVVTEPEGILRAVAFADLARGPTVVGGHMFSLYERSVLHAFGETVARYRWWWGAAPHTKNNHDFARRSLRNTPWLHRRIDVDYNGWWMCLIPTSVVKELGLALPVFIKWDDAEYGLRARGAGYPVVSMPGVAVWHVPWYEKDDAIDWQAYYHLRNRAVAALLHSPYEYGGRLVTESLENQIRHLLCMQYSPAELRLLAIEDLLAGPERLHPDAIEKMTQLRGMRSSFPDAQFKSDLESYPPVRRRKPPRKGKVATAPKGKVGFVKKAALGLTKQALPVRDFARRYPQAAVPHQDMKWWLLSSLDSALVSAADGTGAAWYKRDPKRVRSLLRRSVALHVRLLREWPKLSEEYRAAAAHLTSPERWRETFEASRSPDA